MGLFNKRKRKRGSGLRRALRRAYRVLSVVNTASYVFNAGSAPGALAKHVARKKIVKRGGELIR